jgi:hypothetical protein
MTRVEVLKYPLMMKPARIHLISDIPEPAAYGAKLLTKNAHVNAKSPYSHLISPRLISDETETHCECDVYEPLYPYEARPRVPVVAAPTRIHRIRHFPTTKLAIQPPSLHAIPELEV